MGKQEITSPQGAGAMTEYNRPHLFGSLHREMDRLFDDFGRGWDRIATAGLAPRMDMAETPERLEISLELPGLEPSAVEITLTDGILTVSGQKKAESERKDKAYHLVERSYGAFSRSIRLPAGIEPDKVSADMSKGVLKIVAAKPTAAQTAQIQIKSAS